MTMNKYEAKYAELMKKHDALTKRYAELEKLEEQLNANTELSDEKRLANLEKLAEEYEKVAKLMEGITVEAKKLQEDIESGK